MGIQDIVYTDKEVLDVSGPHGWSEAVLRYLKEVDSSIKGLEDFFGTEAPRYVGMRWCCRSRASGRIVCVGGD